VNSPSIQNVTQGGDIMKPYAHEPFTDFSKKENQAAFLEGLKR